MLYKGLWKTDASRLESTEDLVAAGKTISRSPLEVGATTGSHVGKAESIGEALFRHRLRFGIAASGLLAFIAAAAFWLGHSQTSREQLALEPVRTAIETASMWGSVIIPGAERSLVPEGAALRSVYTPISESLDDALTDLHERFQKESSPADVAHWLVAGYLATGRIDITRDLAEDALRKHPDDVRIVTLSALVAYVDGDLDRAERLLQRALTIQPRDAVAGLNLAVVLAEKGENLEAREILEGIIDRHVDTPFADRARAILEERLP
ncbi:MAG: tetratricopeptide repeat protein [Candidatus Latescibacteria bacterium]|nr:tetratricopeptide repeat protein [Candidatus Latescibacterota bacterium]NIT02514.1 tetratricopeptide repeat protein [Candidatus Latescibacterota bacterium]